MRKVENVGLCRGRLLPTVESMDNPRAALGAVLLVTALGLAGCSSAGSSGASLSGGTSSRSDALAPGIAADGSAGTVKVGTAPQAGKAVDRSVIITGTVTITAGDPISSAAKAITIVEAAGGRVDGRAENAAANGDRGSATLVLRIPAAKLSTTLDALMKLGRADQVQLDSTDVTTQNQDLDARITASRATIARLLQLESTASDTTNLIAIETAVGNRQAELESMEAQQRGLADQVTMSTVTLQLRSDAAAPPIKPADFWSGLGTGWQAFAGFWAAMLVTFGVLIPWLVFTGVTAGAVLLVRRDVGRRRASNAVAPSGAATPPAPIG